MDFRYFNEFLTLAKCQNYHLAAKQLEISQSSLTKHIKILESELNVSLFKRNTRNVELSEFGNIFYSYAEQFVGLFNDCNRALDSKRYRSREVLTIGFAANYIMTDLDPIICGFKKKNPEFVIELINVPEIMLHNMLRYRRCQFVVMPEPEAKEGLKFFQLRKEQAVAVVRKGHQFFDRDKVDIKELRNEKVFVLPQRTTLYNLFSLACREAGFEPDIQCCGLSEIMEISMAEKSEGVAIVSRSSAARMKNSDLSFSKISPPLEWSTDLIYQDVESSPAAQRFLSFLT